MRRAEIVAAILWGFTLEFLFWFPRWAGSGSSQKNFFMDSSMVEKVAQSYLIFIRF
ncbi:MAG: hypothetical protein Ct9H300mP28_00700 [Pseudomonadota bacterium]|nr:MAG: hypothetical protein Ct9H300mP28_00700 [Pseudomonadota bacterium]